MENDEKVNETLEEKTSTEEAKENKRLRKKVVATKSSKPKDVKLYTVTFLKDQHFRGTLFKKDDTLEVPESIAKAYSKRDSLKFTAK